MIAARLRTYPGRTSVHTDPIRTWGRATVLCGIHGPAARKVSTAPAALRTPARKAPAKADPAYARSA